VLALRTLAGDVVSDRAAQAGAEGDDEVSLMLTAYLMEKFGPRLGREELAKVLGVTPKTLEKKVYMGTLGVTTYKDQGKVWADCRDVAEYLDACRAKAKAEAA